MYTKRKLWNFLIAGLVTVTMLQGCSNAKDTQKAASDSGKKEQTIEKVKYAPLSGISGLAVKFGAEKGFFKEEGLDVEFVTAQDPIAGLTSKDVDIVDVATTTAIVAAGKGAPIKIVSSMFRTKGPFYLIARPGINSIEELKGKKVGAGNFGSGLDVYTQVILKKHGISKNDVTYIANGSQDKAFASLEAGTVDATIIHEPFASLAEKTGKGKLLAKGWDYLPTFHTGVLAANDDFVKNHPQAVEKLLRAYFKSQEYAKSHLDEYKKYFLTQVKADPEAVDKAFQREAVLWENNPDVDRKALQDTQQTQLELGFQKEIYDVEKFLDLRYIPKK